MGDLAGEVVGIGRGVAAEVGAGGQDAEGVGAGGRRLAEGGGRLGPVAAGGLSGGFVNPMSKVSFY